MSARIVVTVTSNLLPQIARRLPKQAEAAVKATLDAGKEAVVSGMQASSSPSAPGEMPGIDTGALVGSIATQQAGATGALTAGGGEVDYAAYVNYGTGKMAPRPFMEPAAAHMRKVLERELAKTLKNLGG